MSKIAALSSQYQTHRTVLYPKALFLPLNAPSISLFGKVRGLNIQGAQPDTILPEASPAE